jgi:hypothetical protein
MDPVIPNKTHKVYPIYLLEKLNISNEIKSFPYLHMKTKLSILFYRNICHVIKELRMHEIRSDSLLLFLSGSVIWKTAHYKTQ